MNSGRRDRPEHDEDWVRSERRSFWVALAIALVPIPAALLISWALGSPPWRPRPDPSLEPAGGVHVDFDESWPGPPGHPPHP